MRPVATFASLVALFIAGAWLATAAGCDKPTPGECKRAIENIRQVLGTSQQSEFASATNAWVRSCRGSAKKKAVRCAIESASVEALKGAAKTVVAEYEVPFLAHAAMEPLNCTVSVKADSAEIWVGSQFQTVDQGAAAKALGLTDRKSVV